MSLSQARNEIITSHNLPDNVPLTGIPTERFSEMLEQKKTGFEMSDLSLFTDGCQIPR